MLHKFLALGKVKILVIAAIIAAVVFYGLCYLASIQAAGIFNREIAKQHVLQGSLTVGRLSANPLGKVSFHDLVWTNPQGEKLAVVPAGYIHVRPWDVITRNFTTTTIKSVELDEATINLNFNKDMSVKNVWNKKSWGTSEGYVIRVADSFSYQDFKRCVAKFVRMGHIQTTKHWMRGQPIEPNTLLKK